MSVTRLNFGQTKHYAQHADAVYKAITDVLEPQYKRLRELGASDVDAELLLFEAGLAAMIAHLIRASPAPAGEAEPMAIYTIMLERMRCAPWDIPVRSAVANLKHEGFFDAKGKT